MIEDIQRVNKLAQELLNHGIASSREDAVKQAEAMLNRKLVERDVEGCCQNQVIAERGADYYKNMLERSREAMEKELANVKSALNALASEVRSLREQVDKISNAVRNPIVVAESAPGECRAEKQAHLKVKEPHPKRGDYKPEDVSVEKMFYYGNK